MRLRTTESRIMYNFSNNILKNLLSGKVFVSDTHPIRFLSSNQICVRLNDCNRYIQYGVESKFLKTREKAISIKHGLPRLEEWIFIEKTNMSKPTKNPLPIGTNKSQWLEHLGYSNLPQKVISDEISELNLLQLQNENLAKQLEANFRIEQEIKTCDKEGWYPFFVTLTIDRKKYDSEAVITKGDAQKKYILSIAYRVHLAMGGSATDWKNGKHDRINQLVRYCRVVEHGKTKKHHHMHLLMFLRVCPDEWKIDPTTACKGVDVNLNYREISKMRKLWKYGWSSPQPFFYIGCPWLEKEGFNLPNAKNGQPFNLRPSSSAGIYLTKYLGKEESRPFPHRISYSRNFGLVALKEALQKLDHRELNTLTKRIPSYSTMKTIMKGVKLPHTLVRKVARSILFKKALSSDNIAYYLYIYGFTDPDRVDPYDLMIRSVQRGDTPWFLDSEGRYNWVSSCFPANRKATILQDIDYIAEFYSAWRQNPSSVPDLNNKA